MNLLFWNYLVIQIFACTFVLTISLDNKAAIVIELRKRITFNHIVFPKYGCGNKDLASEWELHYFQRIFSAEGILMTAPQICNGSLANERGFKLTRADVYKFPLIIYPFNEENIKDYLSKGSCLIKGEFRTIYWNVQRILFLEENDDLNNIFLNINVPINCKMLVVKYDKSVTTIMEVYKTENPGNLFKIKLSRWVGGSMLWEAGDRYERSSNLHGKVLNCVTMNNWPFTSVGISNGSVQIGGPVGELWKVLEKEMNFRTNCNIAGTLLDEDFEKKMIAENADVGLTDMVAISWSLSRTAFTFPLRFTRIEVCIRKPERQLVRWLSFLLPFSTRLWYAIGASVLLILLGLSVMHTWDRQGVSKMSLPDAVFIVLAANMQQSLGGTTHRWWFRVVVLVVHAMAIVVMAGYSASLISYLAAGDVILPYKNVDDMIAQNNYKIAMVSRSKEISVLRESKHPTLRVLMQRLYKRHGGSLFETPTDALHAVCDQRNYVSLMQVDNVLRSVASVPCEVTFLPGFSLRLGMVVPLHKNSPYLPIINYNVDKLRSGGILQRIFKTVSTSSQTAVTYEYHRVEFKNVFPVFCCLGVAYTTAFIILQIERLFHYFSLKKIKNKIIIVKLDYNGSCQIY